MYFSFPKILPPHSEAEASRASEEGQAEPKNTEGIVQHQVLKQYF